MIYDAISHLPQYLSLHPLFSSVIEFINSHDLSHLPLGRVNLDNGVYAVISEYPTQDIKGKFLECHKRYIDIQIMAQGAEQIGICGKNECQTIAEYDEEKDYEKLEGKFDLITLKSGYFTIFFPQDAHAPGLKIGHTAPTVKKVVFKVPVI